MHDIQCYYTHCIVIVCDGAQLNHYLYVCVYHFVTITPSLLLLQCTVCHKEFVSTEFMRSHMQRRHPDHLSIEGK